VSRQPTKYELRQNLLKAKEQIKIVGLKQLWEQVEELRHKAAAQDTVRPPMKVQE
jgi:hypothetical protein